MKQVKVTIAGQEFTLLTDGEAAQTQKIAQHVDDQIAQVLAGGRASLLDGAILAALNISEEYFKEVESADNLRRQMKDYLEEATRLKLELSEAKREIFRLEGKK